MPPKRSRQRSSSPRPKKVRKTQHTVETVPNIYDKIATFENADRARQNPPVAQLQDLLRVAKSTSPAIGSSVIYWMRMEDMRRKFFTFPLSQHLTLHYSR